MNIKKVTLDTNHVKFRIKNNTEIQLDFSKKRNGKMNFPYKIIYRLYNLYYF